MPMMRKTIALCLCLALAGTLAGCKSQSTKGGAAGDNGANPNANAQAQKEKPVERTKERQILQDVRVRQALALAFDKQGMVDRHLNNGSKPINYLVPSGLMFNQAGEDFRSAAVNGYQEQNLEKAQALWTEAKTDLKFEALPLKLLTFDAQLSMDLAEDFKTQMEAALPGLTLEVVSLPFEEKNKRAEAGDFDLEFTGWGPDYPDALTYLDLWSSDNGLNVSGYSSETYDQMIAQVKTGALATSVKGDARFKMLQSAEKLLLETDTVVLPIYQRGRTFLLEPAVTGLLQHGYGPSYTFKDAKTPIMTEGEKRLRFAVTEDLTSLDVAAARLDSAVTAMANVGEGLISLGAKDALVPGVAKEWQVSEDGLQYTFKLRQEAKWSDGTPVKASDFVYAWQRLADMGNTSPNFSIVTTAQIKNSAAIDDYTLQVTLNAPVPYFLKLMTHPTFYPIAKDFATQAGDGYGTAVNKTLFNGPFVVGAWENGNGYRLDKNPQYWNASKVFIHGVNFQVLKDATVAASLYDSGELDMVSLAGPLVDRYKGHEDLKISQENTVFFFAFNMR